MIANLRLSRRLGVSKILARLAISSLNRRLNHIGLRPDALSRNSDNNMRQSTVVNSTHSSASLNPPNGCHLKSGAGQRALALLTLSLCVLSSSVLPAEDGTRPNIIFILADDLGYGELGCYGQKIIQTPHLNQMAIEGLQFNQFYAGATVCAPSRSVLMTGLHHGHTRVRGNAGKLNPKAQALTEEDVTVAGVLRTSGYRTALIGKWGLGDVGEAASGLPEKQGFDEFFGYLNQHHAHNHFPDFLWRNEQKVSLPNKITPVGESGGGYATEAVQFADDLFVEEALRFVTLNKDRPFYLQWCLVIPHANNERTRELKNGAHVPDFGPYADRNWPDPDKGHAAMITRLDSYVGRMLNHLKELELDKNTLVVFTSDNGPHNESNHDLKRFQPSGPLSGTKRSLTEGGIRVPAIAWWPGRITAGTKSAHVAYFGDWMATTAELSGSVVPENRDSLSFLPSLLGETARQKSHDLLYWEFHEGGFRQAALYQGRWKALRSNGPDEPIQLFDLQKDVAESQDVSTQQPELTDTLSSYLSSARSESANWPAIWKSDHQRRGAR